MCSHPISVAPSSSKFSYSRIRILEGHIISVATLCELQLGPGLNFQLIFHVSFRRLRHHSGCLGGPLSFYRCPGLGIASIFFFNLSTSLCVLSRSIRSSKPMPYYCCSYSDSESWPFAPRTPCPLPALTMPPYAPDHHAPFPLARR